MRVLCLLFIINAALAAHDYGFGRPYMRSSGRLCHQWNCLNTKLGFTDTLPSQDDFRNTLRDLLGPGPWQHVADRVVNTCYHDRDRTYSNTCPGQAIVHCAVDQLNNNCPEQYTVQNDACAPINSLAGFGNMFTQSIYENLESNIQYEKRPAWFLRNYFSRKCCNMPELFNSTVLTECGFTSMLSYINHELKNRVPPSQSGNVPNNVQGTTNAAGLIIGGFDDINVPPIDSNEEIDPLDCCDMSYFMPIGFRRECNFKLHWDGQNRLVPDKGAEQITTTEVPLSTSERTLLHTDIMVLPQTCEKTTCVFNKMASILTENGSVNIPIFLKLLDNFTNDHPEWTRAKARVVTACLSKPLQYEAECELNKVLACTFDVLTENCPHNKKNDTCKHSHEIHQEKICQISSSKLRPKHRRNTCSLPGIVNKGFLNECGLDSLIRTELVNQYSSVKKSKFSSKHKCQDLTPPMSCVLSKMGVLNKYGFLDYFKMKDKIRNLPLEDGSSTLNEVYMAAFTNYRLYNEHCNSPKKFLNLLDSMILACPDSKRIPSPQCRRLYQNITSLNGQDLSRDRLENMMKHYQHVFLPSENHNQFPKHTRKIVKKPIFNYGLLSSKDAPKVEIIDIKPKTQLKPQQPLVLLPVYMRVPNSNLVVKHNDPLLRKPFWLHDAIAQRHGESTITPTSTIVSTPEQISTTPVPTEYESVTATVRPPVSEDPSTTSVPQVSTTDQIFTTSKSTDYDYETFTETIIPPNWGIDFGDSVITVTGRRKRPISHISTTTRKSPLHVSTTTERVSTTPDSSEFESVSAKIHPPVSDINTDYSDFVRV